MKWYWVVVVSLMLTGCNPGGMKTISDFSDDRLCYSAAPNGRWSSMFPTLVAEAQRRGLTCDVVTVTSPVDSFPDDLKNKVDAFICRNATSSRGWNSAEEAKPFVSEAKRRNLRCDLRSPRFAENTDAWICEAATRQGEWDTRPQFAEHMSEAKRRGLDCGVSGTVQSIAQIDAIDLVSDPLSDVSNRIAEMSVLQLCRIGTQKKDGRFVETTGYGKNHLAIALKRGVNCVSFMNKREALDSVEVRNLKGRLAQLEAEKAQQQQSISQDTQNPVIRIINATAVDAKGVISGIATDNTGVAEIRVDGEIVPIDGSGRFTANIFIPIAGKSVEVVAFDLKGLSTTETVRLERTKRTQTVSRLTPVNPLVGPKQKASRDRVALIIGVEEYARAPSADFASGDAKMFADYAREKLGIPDNNIKILTDSEAEEAAILRALKVWLPKAVKPNATDLYVFYAGHGMPTADGSSAYLVPYDGDIQLLEDTAISRKRFFDEISATKPRSATFFFDNCFSGATRSEELLLASRPLGIRVQETSVPDNYLVFTAGETDQIAGVEPEVKHGRFSYFVFKGLEGEADANSDGKISAGELHTYVKESVGRFSAGAQTPTMLGDSGRWVLR